MEEEVKTSDILRKASLFRIEQVKETLAKKAATHTSEVIYSMECNHRNCENRGKERKQSDFQFGFVKEEKESTVYVRGRGRLPYFSLSVFLSRRCRDYTQ